MRIRSKILTTTIFTITLLGAPLAVSADQPSDQSRAERVEEEAEQIQEAVEVVQEMHRDEGMDQLLRQSKGVFLVPDYGKAALGVGVSGGNGVLLRNDNGQWSNPAFYNFGGVSAGLQAGIEAGQVALILNSQQAVDEFLQNNNWTLSAGAGLTIVDWSGKAQGYAGQDVVVWTDSEGLLAAAEISVSDINFDEDDTASYYGRETIAPNDVFDGKIDERRAKVLKNALAGQAAIASLGTDAEGLESEKGTAYGRDRTATTDRVGESPTGTADELGEDEYAATGEYGKDRMATTDQVGQDEIAGDRHGEESLPRTASPLPLILLAGLAGLGTAAGLRRKRK